MEIILPIINIVTTLWLIISIAGYLIYKYNPSKFPSWEASVKNILTVGSEFIYEELLGKTLTEKIENTSLICSEEEALELVRKLENHPYDTPTLINYAPNHNSIVWFDIESMGMVARYKELSHEERCKLIEHKIQNYFLEIRRTRIKVYIKIATPKRLYFAIPLSEVGMRFLDKQQEELVKHVTMPSTMDVLEEEVTLLFEDEDEEV